MNKIKLNKGEIICPECNGIGIYSTSVNYHTVEYRNEKINIPTHIDRNECSKCKGEGKLDWVENLVGKNNRNSSNITFGNFGPSSPEKGNIYYDGTVECFRIYDGKTWQEILDESL